MLNGFMVPVPEWFQPVPIPRPKTRNRNNPLLNSIVDEPVLNRFPPVPTSELNNFIALGCSLDPLHSMCILSVAFFMLFMLLSVLGFDPEVPLGLVFVACVLFQDFQVSLLVVALTQLEVSQVMDRVSQLAYSIYVLVLSAGECPVLMGFSCML
ncbi:hypothetical protein F511_28528 [Dorcoceras hygrometricum]|uniref:Uncharacterized protein n=1 Tax=Dorcoceras hygrometricum TaxID=472368 RepID=A0A2Z7AM92_9LAMI|nr:hypothetical protein F511_28528 [Dorcoceras hygrometricum]